LERSGAGGVLTVEDEDRHGFLDVFGKMFVAAVEKLFFGDYNTALLSDVP
jgi:hypothetical protein